MRVSGGISENFLVVKISVHLFIAIFFLSCSDATHGVKQTACLCLLKMLRVNASHVPIDQYANKIVQLLNEK